MSVLTSTTGVTSILKTFSGEERHRAKTVAANKVRFSTPKEKGLAESVRVAVEEGNFYLVKEFTFFLWEAELDDDEVVLILKDAKRIVHNLTLDFVNVVEALLSLNWKTRTPEIIEAYTEFWIDIMVAHNRYLPIGVSKLINHWIPGDLDASDWVNGCPLECTRCQLKPTHDVLNRILTAVPMAFDVVMDVISTKFPYFKKPAHVTAGYLFNVLWLIEYKPIFEELILQLVLQKLLVLDVNAPRDQIDVETDDADDKLEADRMFQIDDVSGDNLINAGQTVKHPVGQTLDICLLMLYKFIDSKCRINQNSSDQHRWTANRLFKMLLYIFDEVLLPSHNTHHVQFVLFHVTSIRSAYSEAFLNLLWKKAQNPNVAAIIRHAAVGYMASFLARGKFLPLSTVVFYLKQFSKWIHTYIDESDENNQTCSLKANLVFYSVCQAVFYLIAFRATDLTASSKDLLFLQSLQLSRIAMCQLNPLRYCLAPVATAFAGVTRTYQLAYCHTVLERNARRKLATVYGHDKSMPEETAETFFPFDPYLLKISKKYIEANYVVYQSNDTEDYVHSSAEDRLSRKRRDSEMVEEDEFIILDKRQKYLEISKSQDFDKQY
ncbi:RNA polymerase I-specific transcription initiation factor RRN3 isoform X2 [Drosophila rhopaloa]|uniref:RNA polymerase I-specific transcription initiation factor RRN3 n=1 Tax=Drosophila rhopaloa TaxID=1041015 RepID=A0ABM5J8S4_DRORH|nr:RNA polymerase I-specific transcription initiation factor RRN3 isoform X2 [Drosophila rhopaloa]